MAQEHAQEGARGPILAFATQGAGHLDAQRLRELLEPLGAEELDFDRAHRLRAAFGLWRRAGRTRPGLIVMEGTGIAGGLSVLALRMLRGIPYVVSSGDAVGPYLALSSRTAGLAGAVYERLLCRRCAGYIGWTPYLAGRALSFGAPRAMTAAGWARELAPAGSRERVRERLGIPEGALVAGIVGSLNWRKRIGYAYGAELVRAVRRTERGDLVAVIVGDGPGAEPLRELAGEELGSRILMPGRVAPAEVGEFLAAFDLASLPQSVDRVGSFRYSTKLSEYLAAGLPIVTSQIPAAYDLDEGFCWRLPGPSPWSDTYVEALARLLGGLERPAIEQHRAAALAASAAGASFDRAAQVQRVGEFVRDILSSAAG
jgi:glycosyltransferase involved in cell wall biosynthesis